MDGAHGEMITVLREARALLARSGNCFDWSWWDDAAQALAEVDRAIALLEAGELPRHVALATLFTVTGPIQEVSLSSGWGPEFRAVAERFDRVEKELYS